MVLEFRVAELHVLATETQAERENQVGIQHCRSLRVATREQRSQKVPQADGYSCRPDGKAQYVPECQLARDRNRYRYRSRLTTIHTTDAAWVNAKVVNESPYPERNCLQELHTYLGPRSKSQLPLYESTYTSDYRMLEPKRGPIEKSVKVFMPLHWFGKWLVVSPCPVSALTRY